MITVDIDSYDFRWTYPREFICNYGEGKQRIFAIVEQCDDHPFLETILTCKDVAAADLATHLLNLAMNEGQTPFVKALAEHVTAMLPDAPAASLRLRLTQLYEYRWPRIESRSGDGYGDLASIESSVGRKLHLSRRLKDLTGTVIRAMKLHELHITDPDRVLMAAISQGWGPCDEDARDPGDPNDVLGAAWWLICGSYDKDLPGMERLYGQSGQSIYEQLLVEEGEEVAGWRGQHITVTFETGHFLRQQRQ